MIYSDLNSWCEPRDARRAEMRRMAIRRCEPTVHELTDVGYLLAVSDDIRRQKGPALALTAFDPMRSA